MRVTKLETRHLWESFNPEFPHLDFNVRSEETRQAYDEHERFAAGRDRLASTQELFHQLINRTNGDSSTVSIAMARALSRNHRTLQQSAVRDVLHGIVLWARYISDNDLYDARNEALADMAGDLERFIEEHPLPYV